MVPHLVITGLSTGFLYAGVALGLSLIFGVMKIINFAHGSLFMLSMYISYYAWKMLGMGPIFSGILAAAIMFVLGYWMQSFFIMPLFEKERAAVVEPMSVLLMTCAFWLIIDNSALVAFGADYRTLTGYPIKLLFTAGNVPVYASRFYLSCLTGGLCLFFHFFLLKSNIGRAIRATSQNRDAAALYGINVPRIYAITFGLGSLLIGFTGAAASPILYIHPTAGLVFSTKAFVIVVLGGMGNTLGAFVGGVCMGLIEAFAGYYTTAVFGQAVFLIVFIIVLVVKPKGLFSGG